MDAAGIRPALLFANPDNKKCFLDPNMNEQRKDRTYPVEEALKAQRALREAAGLEREQFPVQAFVGMISDEIEVLREQGRSDAQIASLIAESSSIRITAHDVRENYASPEERHSSRS